MRHWTGHGARRLAVGALFWSCGAAAAAAQSVWVLTDDEDGVFSPSAGAQALLQNGESLVYGLVDRGPAPSATIFQNAPSPTTGYNRFAAIQFGAPTEASVFQNGAFNRAILLQIGTAGPSVINQTGAVSNIGLSSLDATSSLSAASDAELQALVRTYLFAPETTQVAPEMGAAILGGFARRLTAARTIAPAEEGRPLRLRFGLDAGRENRDPRQGAVGYSANRFGAEAGLEYAPSPHWRVGALVGAARSNGTYDLGLGDVDADSIHGGLYAEAEFGAFDLAASVAYGRLSYDLSRPGPSGGVTADPKGDALAASASAAWTPDIGPFRAGPVIGLDFVRAKTDAYAERGDAFSRQIVGERETKRLDGRIGAAAIFGDFNQADSPRLTLGAFYVRELDGDDAEVLISRFGFFPAADIRTPLVASDRGGRLALESSLRVRPTPNLTLEGRAAGEFGGNGQELSAQALVRIDF